MIHQVTANHPTFHPVTFGPGLNLVIAERTATSAQKDTRNGLGKTSLLEIIDFCLGSSGKSLCIPALKSWAFTLEITLSGNRVKATRSIDKPKTIVIEGPTIGWVEQPDEDEETKQQVFSLERWKVLLGLALFGLARTDDGFKYRPTYRSLFSYFNRLGLDAYHDPFRHFRAQKPWDTQLNIAFLLGLSWQLPSKGQELKDQEQALKALGDAAKAGVLEGRSSTLGELEAERVQVEEQVKQEREALASFKVHPQYENIQTTVDQQTAEIHRLVNENVLLRRKLAQYKEAVESEQPPDPEAIESLYKEVGIVFPGAVKKTLADAKDFHFKIIENRKAFLSTEIERIEAEIKTREKQTQELTNKRAELLEILQTHGALQEHTRLQEHHVETKERLEQIRSSISNISELTSKKRTIKIARTELAKVMEQDHQEKRGTWEKAVRLFNDHSLALYKSPGRLVIDITETGYVYEVEIDRSGSEGIGKMKIFCFDLLLLQTLCAKGGCIDFLLHDSVLYDGVDSRQKALAIELAARTTAECGAQYICTMNSDMIPEARDFSPGFDIKKYVKLTLTDKDPGGSLLGIQFQRGNQDGKKRKGKKPKPGG